MTTTKEVIEFTVEGTYSRKGNKLSLSVVGTGNAPVAKTCMVRKLTATSPVLNDNAADKVMEFTWGK